MKIFTVSEKKLEKIYELVADAVLDIVYGETERGLEKYDQFVDVIVGIKAKGE